MTDRLEVTAGAGAVIKVGTITAWIGPSASARLLDFIVRTTHNAPRTPTAAQAAADQMIAVLRTGDPEPLAPFAVVGGGAGGMVALLHGPVQLWDGTRVVAPSPSPGWLACALGAPVLAAVAAHGTSLRGASGSVFDLRDGVVPGSGFVLVPDPGGGPGGTGPTPYATSVPFTPSEAPSPGGGASYRDLPPAPGASGAGASDPRGYPLHSDPRPTITPAAATDWPRADPSAGGRWDGPGGQPVRNPTRISSQRVPPPPPPPKLGEVEAGALAAPVTHRPTVARASATGNTNRSDADVRPPPDTVIDLTAPGEPGAPLPPLDAPGAVSPGATFVDGVRCGRGHFNHPAAASCLRCAGPITDRTPLRGPRPSLGVLVRDDSTVLSLEKGYVLGTDPERDPSVSGGIARPLRLEGPSTAEVSPVHAELRLSGWEVTLIDRGSDYGTFVLRPGENEWERLSPYQADVLTPGTHLACGQRILTYASPWPAAI